ncbi:hypothetical protein Sango_1597700 [Sesamum angolense]|uniref:Uncharacterized protein n=1 Tax=Sesamum angolense TaxID=2727404 RepID=A0AAE1WJF7_9LAMI|nr:hypothetical protein Sango_1597700 [Sesamum angolense]
MEDSAAKDHQSSARAGRSTSRLLRYPLRSATRSREEKPSVADSNTDSATKRGRPASTVSKSVGILDLSGKEKSAKPPRRLSVPSKSNATPAPKSFGNITPISEARTKRSAGNQGKSDTPRSDVSRSSNRKKFSVLSSASYWLSQIKLSESAAKHLISLGFFKLALEAGCELLLSITNAEKLTPKLLDVNAAEIHQIKKENDEITQKNDSMKKTRRSAPKNAASSKSGSEVRGRSIQKKPQKPMKQESGQANNRVKKQGHKSAARAEGPPNSAPEEALEENKENMATPQREEIASTEV